MPDALTPEAVAELRRLKDAASPLPWKGGVHCTCTFRLSGEDDDHHENACAVTLWRKGATCDE